MKTDTFLKFAFAEVCGLLSTLFGEMDGLFTALIVFMILDYITGIFVGISQKRLDSEIGFKGILKKLTMLIVVALGHVLDAYVLGGACCKMIAVGFYLANEGLSILENTAKLGVKYPKKLLEVLKQLKEDDDDDVHGN